MKIQIRSINNLTRTSHILYMFVSVGTLKFQCNLHLLK